MSLSRSTALALALASPTFAQVRMNEVFVSHTGSDDQEFIELIGPASFDLGGYMLLVVDGDGANAGLLDVAISLSGHDMGDGYFVIGDSAVAGLDLDLGADNFFENGSETIYLVSGASPPGIVALVGTDLDSDDDGLTDIPLMCTVEDLIALVDTGFGSGDEVFDNAPVFGPDGSFFPAGIWRGGDWPSAWCDSFLDFHLGPDRTPGSANIACPSSGPSSYCAPANANSVSAGGALLSSAGNFGTASATFDLTEVPDQPGLLFAGNGTLDVPFGCGRRCVGGTTLRGSVIVPSGHQLLGVGFDMSSPTTLEIQYWYRDPLNLPACGSVWNLSNALMP